MAMFKNMVVDICELYEAGKSVEWLAEKFRMDVDTIKYVIANYSVEAV